jgi:hypothetical protein
VHYKNNLNILAVHTNKEAITSMKSLRSNQSLHGFYYTAMSPAATLADSRETLYSQVGFIMVDILPTLLNFATDE